MQHLQFFFSSVLCHYFRNLRRKEGTDLEPEIRYGMKIFVSLVKIGLNYYFCLHQTLRFPEKACRSFIIFPSRPISVPLFVPF